MVPQASPLRARNTQFFTRPSVIETLPTPPSTAYEMLINHLTQPDIERHYLTKVISICMYVRMYVCINVSTCHRDCHVSSKVYVVKATQYNHENQTFAAVSIFGIMPPLIVPSAFNVSTDLESMRMVERRFFSLSITPTKLLCYLVCDAFK